jgi:hypothetical protein
MRQASVMTSFMASVMTSVMAALALALILANSELSAQNLPQLAPPQQAPLQQAPTQEPAITPKRKLNLTVEQRFTIRELIKDVKSKPASAPAPAVGDAIPADVQPQPMPDAVAQKVPQVKAHKFFVAKDEIVIVDPKDNTVAELIKLEN